MRTHALKASLIVLLALAGCGSGGGGGSGGDCLFCLFASSPNTPSPPPPPSTFTAVAMAGELVSYKIDRSLSTYSYTITDSMYGLAGKSGSGQFTINPDGSFSPQDIPNAKIVVTDNGLLLGAIRETINGTLTTIPIIGMSLPLSVLAEVAATYDVIQRSCLGGNCTTGYGTFEINANGTWRSCSSGNLVTGCVGPVNSGSLNSLGNGTWQVLQGVTQVGTAVATYWKGQNIIMVDLTDIRADGFGVGILVGTSEQSIDTTQTNGTWVAAATNGNWQTFTASGNQITYQTINGTPAAAATTLTLDSPWQGFEASPAGGYGLLAGTRLYAFETTGGYAEIGVKLD